MLFHANVFCGSFYPPNSYLRMRVRISPKRPSLVKGRSPISQIAFITQEGPSNPNLKFRTKGDDSNFTLESRQSTI